MKLGYIYLKNYINLRANLNSPLYKLKFSSSLFHQLNPKLICLTSVGASSGLLFFGLTPSFIIPPPTAPPRFHLARLVRRDLSIRLY